MPYRIDLRDVRGNAVERLIDLGALDIESGADGAVAALMPDGVTPEEVTRAVGAREAAVSSAVPRDDGSVWILSPRPTRVGRLQIVPAHLDAEPGVLRLIDATAFGTGLHPTTTLCLEALEEAVRNGPPDAMLDVGTGSGVLALAALMFGVRRVVGLDIDDEALRVAAANARLNGIEGRFDLIHGGPGAVSGAWPLVLANVLAAPLIDMAPALVRRVEHRGRAVLSGIPASLERDVDEVYRHLGMQRVGVTSRAGWMALVLQATW